MLGRDRKHNGGCQQLCLIAPDVSAEDLARRLRMGRPAVVPTVKSDTVRLDLRTVRPHQDEALAEAIVTALS